MKRQWKRTLSVVLSIAMLFSMTGMNTVFATEGGTTIGASGQCEHHTEHTTDCGYAEGTPEASCSHEHGDECYKEVTKCVHKHTDDCYDETEGTATDSEAQEPVNCSHICDEDSGCITEELDCQHEHDEDCGYAPAIPGTPCTFQCEDCGDKDSGQQTPPPVANDPVQNITGFVGFDPDSFQPLRTITVDEKTTVAAIGLPETLAVTLDGAEGETAIPVTWECADDYENTEYETYDFTPVLGEGYTLAEGLDAGALPYITVNIAGVENLLAKGSIPEDVTALITKINVWDPDGAGTTHTADQITANWDAENDTVTVSDQLTGDGVFSASQGLALDIPAGVTVMWQPSCNFSAVGLFISGEGDFVLDGSAKLTAQSSSPQTNHTAIYNDGGNVTVPSQTKVQATGSANKPAIYNEGVLEVSGTVSSEGGNAIQNKSGATANILDGAVVSASGNVETIRNETGCTLTISGGTISHSRDYGMAVVNLGALTMADGEIKSTGTQGKGLSTSPGSSAFVSDGAITASGTDGTAFLIDGGTIALTGGTFTGTTRFSGSAKAILAYLAGVTCPLPYSISGNNGTVVEIDSLSIPASRNGTGEGITVKVAGQTWDNHLTTTAEWDTSGGTPQIVVDVTDSADTFTYTANMDWGTKTGGDTQPAFTSDNHLECGEQGNMLDLTVTGFTPTSYSLSGTVPEGVSVQEDEGTWALVVLYGAPVGVHTFTVNATDGNTTITQTFTLTVNSDSATVTTTIDCTGFTGDQSGDGWVWAHSTKTLTLTDVDVDVASGDAISVPAAAEVDGVDGTSVTISAGGSAIDGDGDLKVGGKIKRITSTSTVDAHAAINAPGNAMIGAAIDTITATNTNGIASYSGGVIQITSSIGTIAAKTGINARCNEGATTNIEILGTITKIESAQDGISTINGDVTISGAVGEIDSGWYGISAGGDITISKPITVRGGGLAFNKEPVIGGGLKVTAWSKNADGSSPETGAIDWDTAKYVVIGTGGSGGAPVTDGTFDLTQIDNLGASGGSDATAWTWDAADGLLTLSGAGPYTLTGDAGASNLRVLLDKSGAELVLDNASFTNTGNGSATGNASAIQFSGGGTLRVTAGESTVSSEPTSNIIANGINNPTSAVTIELQNDAMLQINAEGASSAIVAALSHLSLRRAAKAGGLAER